MKVFSCPVCQRARVLRERGMRAVRLHPGLRHVPRPIRQRRGAVPRQHDRGDVQLVGARIRVLPLVRHRRRSRGDRAALCPSRRRSGGRSVSSSASVSTCTAPDAAVRPPRRVGRGPGDDRPPGRGDHPRHRRGRSRPARAGPDQPRRAVPQPAWARAPRARPLVLGRPTSTTASRPSRSGRCSATRSSTTRQRSNSTTALPDDGSWLGQFVSFYASMHPWEDFAESFAHLLHLTDTLETAAVHGMVGGGSVALGFGDFDKLYQQLDRRQRRPQRAQPQHGHPRRLPVRPVAAGSAEAGLRLAVPDQPRLLSGRPGSFRG